MKTRLYLAFVLAIMFIMPGTNVFAEGRTGVQLLAGDIGATNVNLGVGSVSEIQVSISKGVTLQYDGSRTEYAVGTLHMSGDRDFGSNETATTIWYAACANVPCIGDAAVEPTMGDDATADIPAGWSSN